MSGGNFDGASFDGSIGGFDVDLLIDTHDGFDSNRKRYDEEREERKRLRDMLAYAVDPDAYIAPPAEAIELAAPFVERLESGAVRVDWERIGADVAERLYAYAEEYERRRREFEEDEEDAMILLLN